MIYDGTDSLPHKGYILADQDLIPTFDKLDRLLDKVGIRGRVSSADYMDARYSHPHTRQIYQCSGCGRILIWDKKIGGAFSFKPEDADVNKRLLEGQHHTA